MIEDTGNLSEATRFKGEEIVLKYWKMPITIKMRECFDMEVVEVECIVREYCK